MNVFFLGDYGRDLDVWQLLWPHTRRQYDAFIILAKRNIFEKLIRDPIVKTKGETDGAVCAENDSSSFVSDERKVLHSDYSIKVVTLNFRNKPFQFG